MVNSGALFLIELAVLGACYIIMSYMEYKASTISEVKPFFRTKTISASLFVLGILVHTIGDAWKYEMEFETIGHFVIMLGAIILIKQTIDLWKIVEEFSYG